MSTENKCREVIFYKNYFVIFLNGQNNKAKDKILWTLKLIEELAVIPTVYFKHIKNAESLYEIRIQQGTDIYRIFCFFDTGKLVVLMNGFVKKTQKTPKSEIEKALKIKKEYETEKQANAQ
jgi:phage-related protein